MKWKSNQVFFAHHRHGLTWSLCSPKIFLLSKNFRLRNCWLKYTKICNSQVSLFPTKCSDQHIICLTLLETCVLQLTGDGLQYNFSAPLLFIQQFFHFTIFSMLSTLWMQQTIVIIGIKDAECKFFFNVDFFLFHSSLHIKKIKWYLNNKSHQSGMVGNHLRTGTPILY